MDPRICRLFIDEVGNGGRSGALALDNERYLSLTGIVTRMGLYESRFVPELVEFKQSIFGPEGHRIVLHRREIRRRENEFRILLDSARGRAFDDGLLKLIKELPYIASTVCIDKREHLRLYGDWTRDPYHYCLEVLVERYVLWMSRHRYVGDVVIEARGKGCDKRVKAAFERIFERGTGHLDSSVIQQHLTSREIKLATKLDHCPAMQMVDLLAHPSARAMRYERLGLIKPDDFGSRIVEILERWKYARHPRTHLKIGWGKKWLP